MLDPSPQQNPHFKATETRSAIDYRDRAHRTAQNYANFQSWNSIAESEAEKRLIKDDVDGVSGYCSPPIWRTSPPTSPQHRKNHYRSLSPSSRAQAIARGQKELMEIVNKMPEGCYELTLKDIVEQKDMIDEVHEQKGAKDGNFSKERTSTVTNDEKKKSEKKARMSRSESIDNGGLLLKLVFPIPWSSRNKKKNKKKQIKKNDISVKNNSGRVSPKPLLFDGSGGVKGEENEWWKNRFHEEDESCDSGGFSVNSGSSKSSGGSSSTNSSRNNSGRQASGGCWSFIFRRGKKKDE